MEKKTELRIFQYIKESKTPAFKKTIKLPIYLADTAGFITYIQKHCGCHNFHIEFLTSYKRWLTLCDIEIKRRKKTGTKYHIPNPEHKIRLKLLLEKNKKPRDRLKIAEHSSKKMKVKKEKDHDDIYYG